MIFHQEIFCQKGERICLHWQIFPNFWWNLLAKRGSWWVKVHFLLQIVKTNLSWIVVSSHLMTLDEKGHGGAGCREAPCQQSPQEGLKDRVTAFDHSTTSWTQSGMCQRTWQQKWKYFRCGYLWLPSCSTTYELWKWDRWITVPTYIYIH